MYMTFMMTYLLQGHGGSVMLSALTGCRATHYPPLNYLYPACSEYSKRRIKTQNQGFDVPLGAYGNY